MRPILLKGHERSITCVVYNRDGDLIFTAAGRPPDAMAVGGRDARRHLRSAQRRRLALGRVLGL